MAWKFYRSSMYENIDATTHPAYEDGAAPSIVITDSLGATIADTAVVPDLIDTKPGKRIKLVYAGPDNDKPSFNTAFTVRSDVDFVAFLGHTARECFPETISNVFDSEVPNDISVEPTKLFSGFLGKGRPYLNFDGVNDVVTVSDNAALDITLDQSIEVLFRPHVVNVSGQSLIGKFLGTGSQRSYLLDLQSDEIQYRVSDDGAFNATYETTDAANLETNTWYYLVVVYDASAQTIVFYLDGTLLASTTTGTIPTSVFAGTSNVTIGAQDTTGGGEFNGDIRLARVWNRALSSSEITDFYNGGIKALADHWGSQTALNVSNLVNDGGGFAYDTLERVGGGGAPNTATEFHAITDGTGSRRRAGTADEIVLIAGVKYGVFFNLSLASGTAPFYDLRQELNGNNSVTDDGPQGSSAGNNYFEFTASSTVTAVMQFYSTTASEYTMTLLNVIRLGAVAEYDTEGINEDDGKWYDWSNNALDGTNTGVVYRDTPNGTDEEFTLIEIDEVQGAVSVGQEINATSLAATGTFYFGQVMVGKSFIPIAPDLLGQDNISEAGTPLFQSHGGQRSANKRYDKRGRWTRTWSFISVTEKANWENFLEGSKEFPFLFTPDDTITSGGEPIFYLGRVVNDYTFTEVAFDVWSLTLTIEEEL